MYLLIVTKSSAWSTMKVGLHVRKHGRLTVSVSASNPPFLVLIKAIRRDW